MLLSSKTFQNTHQSSKSDHGKCLKIDRIDQRYRQTDDKKNPATDASQLKAQRDDFVFGRSWRGDETNLYSNDPEGVTRRSILLAILKDLRSDLGILRSWRGEETTLYRLFARDHAMILGFDYFEEKWERLMIKNKEMFARFHHLM